MAAGKGLVLVYLTARNSRQAGLLGSTLVREKLAACANILGPIISIYRWKGTLHRDREVALLLKTRASLVEALTKRVVALHPYEIPCVIAVGIVGGLPAFLRWIETETVVSRSAVRPASRSGAGSKAAAKRR
jgi:periplasmic divalent cation tolerance protein